MWPVLKRHKARNTEEMVQILLLTLRGKSLKKQLEERGIIMMHLRPLLTPGGLCLEINGFVVLINRRSSLAEMGITLGHEIGHTFGYDTTKRPPKRIWPSIKKWIDEEEDFAEIFGRRWWEECNQGEIKKFLMNTCDWREER